jgi:hypothetical protein|uniref:Uncharacterized protein n=1 Tax=Zea mays TaxID=4577 RepID=A0A804NNE0_MAIZE
MYCICSRFEDGKNKARRPTMLHAINYNRPAADTHTPPSPVLLPASSSVGLHAVDLVERRLEDVEEHPADGGRDDDEQQEPPVVVGGRGRSRSSGESGEVLRRGGGGGLGRGRHPGGGGAEAQAGDHGLAAHAVELVQRRLQDVVEHPPDGGRHHEEQQLPAVVAPGVGRRRHVRHALRRQRRVRRRQRREEGARQRGRHGRGHRGLLGPRRDAQRDAAAGGRRRRPRHDPGGLQQGHRGYGRHGGRCLRERERAEMAVAPAGGGCEARARSAMAIGKLAPPSTVSVFLEPGIGLIAARSEAGQRVLHN